MNRNVALIYPNPRIPFVFEEAAAAGIDITVIHPPGVVPPHLPAVRQTLSLDVYSDESAAIEVLSKLHQQKPFDGITTLLETCVPFTAAAALALGLRGISKEAALAARDKSRMRVRFREAGLNYPKFVRLNSPRDLDSLEGLDFPAVVKPASGFASYGVTRVDDVESLRKAVAEVDAMNHESLAAINHENITQVSHSGGRRFAGIVVEEFVDGPEYGIESFAKDGEVHVLSIAYKGDPKGPYFEEGIYLAPAPLSNEVQAEIVDQVKRAILALGLNDGPTHTELRLLGGKTPYVLEIAARFGASGVTHFVVERSTGINYVRLALENVMEGANLSDVPEAPAPIAAAGIYSIPIGGDGIVAGIDGLEKVRRHPATKRILQFLFPGDVVLPYPRWSGYPGFVLSQHASYAEGEEFHRMLDRKLAVRYA
jgi:biotin carboxylase